MIEGLWSGEHKAQLRARYILKPERSSETQKNHDPSPPLSPDHLGFAYSQQNIPSRRQAKRISRVTSVPWLQRAKSLD